MDYYAHSKALWHDLLAGNITSEYFGEQIRKLKKEAPKSYSAETYRKIQKMPKEVRDSFFKKDGE